MRRESGTQLAGKTRAAEPQERKLGAYRKKRHFEKTPEPSGRTKLPRRKLPIFVVQKHSARRLHYDFRLEVGGVLKSWAVPKGPSMDPSEKRLAVMVEDHPLDYAAFEGNIPAGEYGAGPVLIWDAGYFTNIKQDSSGREIPMARCIDDGRVEIELEGRKLSGRFALVKTGFRRERGENNWLLIKMKDDAADAHRNPVETEPESVVSRRTIEEVAADVRPAAQTIEEVAANVRPAARTIEEVAANVRPAAQTIEEVAANVRPAAQTDRSPAARTRTTQAGRARTKPARKKATTARRKATTPRKRATSSRTSRKAKR